MKNLRGLFFQIIIILMIMLNKENILNTSYIENVNRFEQQSDYDFKTISNINRKCIKSGYNNSNKLPTLKSKIRLFTRDYCIKIFMIIIFAIVIITIIIMIIIIVITLL